ncbi:transcriptional regulator, LysR family [Andreprevotia lacus DSM 23236]|jgi:DNA-binding transcriptional LysR family regulator|uniref:Transcriptional regulator, LysR family n=1 Tax=Andreprevotia lacus DSM 23236 TaxID=1121001 RepID=A0A1W1XXC5_9NEIS|nr:LysR family transcriptional regulator [Andreprevotia lacus]SMC28619.1 transcriptional regulator, LysR family [Andreprevotia lacus DSM 23236]
MTNTIPWELYRSLLAVLQEGSLSAAARALDLTQPTVGRHISALEAALGQTLFTRSQAGLLPTDAALALRPHAEAMHSTAAALERMAHGLGSEARGPVRISASEIVGVEVLPPLLAPLRDRYPHLEIELLLSNRVQDLVLREADIAVRMTPPQQDVLLAARVDDAVIGLYAHERYLQQHGTPTTLEALAGHALIGFDTETPFLRSAAQRFSLWQRANFAWRSDNDLAQRALLRAGAGIGVCQTRLVQPGSGLVRLFAQEFALPLPTWVVMHADLRSSLRCKVVFDALVQGLRAGPAVG